MEELFDILSNLEVRFFESLPPKSKDHTSTAIFQFVSPNTNKFLVQVDANRCLRFEAYYQHKGKYYPHPYTLRAQFNQSVNNTLSTEHYRNVTYDISLYLELKCLRDFQTDDLKRYYEAVDKNIDSNEELHDFHDVYLILHYKLNGLSCQYRCNNSQPMHLPKFISNAWTQHNTLTRFRYDAENRDGIFPCEMTLRCGKIANLQSYKIVICLISNTIPGQMDYHAIRWLYKIKSRGSTRQVDKEKSYCLNHSSGIVVAQVFGPDLKFTPQMLHSMNRLNYVQSYFEPEDLRAELANNSGNNDTGALAIVVIKGTDYPKYMKNRRKDKSILRYLPFNELEDVDTNLDSTDDRITKRLKSHKELRVKQLILFDNDEKGTYSQAHVRLYVAAYDEHDTLLAEALHPPLRNNKTFEQLRIIRIVQPRTILQANEPAFIYCEYDYSKLKLEPDVCPYEFEIVFTRSLNTPDNDQLLQLFNRPHMCVRASSVPNCPCLLQFQVPNDPNYHEHRIFIRLRHIQSNDYNSSAIALVENERWTYNATPTSVIDMILENDFRTDNDPSESTLSNSQQNIELRIQPVTQSILLHNTSHDSEDTDEDINNSNTSLNTPDFDSTPSKRFTFPDMSPGNTNHE